MKYGHATTVDGAHVAVVVLSGPDMAAFLDDGGRAVRVPLPAHGPRPTEVWLVAGPTDDQAHARLLSLMDSPRGGTNVPPPA